MASFYKIRKDIKKNQLMNKIQIEQIEKIIGVKFNKKKILEQAFIHKSVSKEIEINNERLEFLGDRVLGLVIAANLNKIYPTDSEGQLDKKLALLVNKSTCAKIIQDLKLNNFLNLSKSQKKNKFGNEKIFGDLCESLIGAVYLDQGFEITNKVVLKLWKNKFNKISGNIIDPKTKLQEYSLKKFKKLPIYKNISNHGPSHKPIFKVSVNITGSKAYIADGRSKKIAQSLAAKKLLQSLKI